VKLYVREADSGRVAAWVRRSTIVATSRVAYAEARAAFARRNREGGLSSPALRRVVQQLDRDLDAFVVVELHSRVAHRAGALAEKHALRGFDAIHLASALDLSQFAASSLAFVAYDAALMSAAVAEGLTVPS
jgi:predicted nucleic acid-binding protein